MTVNKQETFSTYFCKTNDNLFHSETNGVMGQAPFRKKVGHVILIQPVTSVIDISFSSNLWNKTWWSPTWGKLLFKHVKSLTESLGINDSCYWSSWYKSFLGVLRWIQIGEVTLFRGDIYTQVATLNVNMTLESEPSPIPLLSCQVWQINIVLNIIKHEWRTNTNSMKRQFCAWLACFKKK